MEQIDNYIIEKLKLNKNTRAENIDRKEFYEEIKSRYSVADPKQLADISFDDYDNSVHIDLFRDNNYRYTLEYRKPYTDDVNNKKFSNYISLSRGIQKKDIFNKLSNEYLIVNYQSKTSILERLLVFPKDKNKDITNDFCMEVIDFIYNNIEDPLQKLITRNK